MSTRRKMLAADESIANKIVEMAKRRELTVYQTVNDVLEQALRADEMGLSLMEVVDERGMVEKAKKMGLTFFMEALLYDLVDLTYSNNHEQLSELCLETGRWYGKYFTGKADDGINAFNEAMKLLTFGSSVYKIKNHKDGSVSVSCVGERFTSGYTEAFGLFISGVLETLGMKLIEKENSDGIIRLRFEKSR